MYRYSGKSFFVYKPIAMTRLLFFSLLVTAINYTAAQNVGINNSNPDRPLTIRAVGENAELLSLRDTANNTRWHINFYGGGLNFTQTGIVDGRFFLSELGRAGIGTSEPKNILDVKGSMAIGDYAGSRSAPYNGLLVEGATGIGTYNPLAKLDVRDDSANRVVGKFRTTGGFSEIMTLNGTDYTDLGIDPAGGYVGTVYTGKNFRIRTGGIDRMFFDHSTGNVGIGQPFPQSKLDVEGNMVIGVGYSGSNAAPPNGLLIQGNTGIGTLTVNEKLVVNGAIKIADGGYTSLTNNAASPVPAGGAGTLAFSNGHFFGWTGSLWKQLDN